MDSAKITHLRDGWHKNNSPKNGELNGRHENSSPKGWTTQSNSPKGWSGGELYGWQEITREKDGWVESYMVGMKITSPRDGWHKNNSPKGWACGELYGRH